jgi:hypothetical protein
MPTKGSPIVPIRFADADLLAAVDAAVESSVINRSGKPWTRTSFILAAVREKLAHLERSKRSRVPKPADSPKAP